MSAGINLGNPILWLLAVLAKIYFEYLLILAAMLGNWASAIVVYDI